MSIKYSSFWNTRLLFFVKLYANRRDKARAVNAVANIAVYINYILQLSHRRKRKMGICYTIFYNTFVTILIKS